MKKKLLAAGVAVALGALSGVASAALSVNATGVGSINVIPYYSVQNGNDTLISIVNTDVTNGKAVKVRFRGAEWSDDVFDFQVFLSPGDVWTGAVSKNSTTGLAKMVSSDSTCTLPANINQDFVPIRLQSGKQPVGTLEGYVEIITMADIVPGANPTWVEGQPLGLANAGAGTNSLYSVIKHPTNGKPACRTSTTAAAVLSGLTQDNVLVASTNANQLTWMVAPTASLTSYATIINVPTSRAFTNVATAMAPAASVKQYFRQANEVLAFNANLTADRIFAPVVSPANATAATLSPTTLAAAADALGANVPMYQFDMPDLSTPHDTDYTANLVAGYGGAPGIQAGSQAALAQRDALAALLAKSAIISEYVTSDSIGASTDIVISQPIRRYFYEYRLADTTVNTNNGHLTLPPDASGQRFFIAGPAQSPQGIAAVLAATPYGGLNGATNRIQVGAPTFFDREENTPVASDDIVISPTPPTGGGTYSLMGEVSVISINNGGASTTEALSASLTINDYTPNTASSPMRDGWVQLSTVPTAPAGQRLPVLGFTAINIFNAGVGAAGTNYGMSVPQRYAQ